jgi:carbon dioxide concentrating mechanism protein CcmO
VEEAEVNLPTSHELSTDVFAHRQVPDMRHKALGLVSAHSFPAIIGTADMMLKSAGVTLVGFEKIGSGHCTAVVRGRLADVRIAVEAGAETAQQFGQFVSKIVIPRPLPNLDAVLPIGSKLLQLSEQRGYSRLSNQAIGLLETIGFPAMVGAADAMLKSAEVQLASYEMIGSGLCTAIIRGNVADVTIAIESGMHEAERIGELHSVMIIPRPLDDLEHTLPVASCWLDQPKPLTIPLDLREKEAVDEAEQQHIELPDLRELPMAEEELELRPESSPHQDAKHMSQEEGE